MAPPTVGSDSSLSTKACMACRAFKVRCIIDSASEQRRCQRCSKSDRECVFPAPQKRKQRKRTDVRVAELEHQIHSMRGLMGRNKDECSNSQVTSSDGVLLGLSEDANPPAIDRAVADQEPSDTDPQAGFRDRQPLQPDQFNPSTITATTAKALFNIYNKDLVDHFPVVIFPENLDVAVLRIEKPTLFLAMMAAAARKAQPELSTILNKQVLQSYSSRVFMNNEKSLELVQAMIITAVWYSPPEGSNPGQYKYYEYIHMAASMALDLGLGTKPLHTKASQTPFLKVKTPTPDAGGPISQQPMHSGINFGRPINLVTERKSSIDADYQNRRTFLSCYLICCGVSLSMRRPNMLRYNSWIAECADYLRTLPAATLSDKRLVAWTKLLSICEEVSIALSFEDLSQIAKVDRPQTRSMIKVFEQRLCEWRIGLESGVMNGALELCYHHTNIYLHEIALHDDHSPEDFKPPYSFEKLRIEDHTADSTIRYLDIILHCITSAHRLIETLLHMEIESLRTLPIFNYIRFSYAIFVLEVIATSSNNTSHGLSSFFTRDSLQIDHYSTLVIKHLALVVGPAKCKTPSIFLGLMLRLQEWHRRHAMQPNEWLAPAAGRPIMSAEPATAEQTASIPSRSQWPNETVMNSTDIFNNQQTPAHGARDNSNTPIPHIDHTPSLTSSGPTPQDSTPRINNALQGFDFDPSSHVNETYDGHSIRPEAVDGFESMLDFPGDYPMDLDPGNLFLFDGMDTWWGAPHTYGVLMQDAHGPQNDGLAADVDPQY